MKYGILFIPTEEKIGHRKIETIGDYHVILRNT